MKIGTKYYREKWLLMAVIIVMNLPACQMLSNIAGIKISPAIQTQPAVIPFNNIPMPSEGSLWTDSAKMLVTDNKAKYVGDTVIVDIIENTSSSLDANTKASRTTTMGVGVSDFMGVKRSIMASNPMFDVNNQLIGSSYSNTFDGKGENDRSGQLTASIAARVTEVYPNGNIHLYGKREMKVNTETQYITVTGIIRPEDIDSSNRVKSTFLADSSIEYSGRGVLADKQKAGWASRIIDNLWPF
jgi:flagellar L-ring protein precursor FlgH